MMVAVNNYKAAAMMQSNTTLETKKVKARAPRRSSAPTEMDNAVMSRIRTIRVQKGLTQGKVADHIGIVHQQYHKYESGLNRLSVGMTVKIAEALNCSISELFPPEFDRPADLDPDRRLDVLKQDIIAMVMEEHSETGLAAISALLSELRIREPAA